MVHLIKKKVNGNEYCYLQENVRINGKTKRLWQIYLGPTKRIQEYALLTKPEKLEYETVEFGADVALYNIAKKIKLIEVIDRHTDKKRSQGLTVGEYILIAAINRCIKPYSKRMLSNWFRKSFLTGYFQISSEILNSQTYWNHFSYLNDDIYRKIEVELSKIILDEYNLDLNCVLYDPTNFYTYIQEHENNELPAKGHSKEKRYDLNQVNLSLFCLRDGGVPLMYKVYPGNMNDPTHFKSIISEFTKRMTEIGASINEIVMIFDKGNHSNDAYKEINKSEMKFIASLRPSTQKDLIATPLDKFTMIKLKSTGKEVGYYHIKKELYKKERDIYVVFDPRHYKRVKLQFEKRLEKKIQSIKEYFKDRLNKKKWGSVDNVKNKIESMLGKKLYNTIVKVDLKGGPGHLTIQLDIDETKRDEQFGVMGKSILFTNCDNWAPELIIRTFREQYIVESAFKYLKNPKMIAVRPMYHYTDNSIRAHIFICILGLLLLSLLRLELSKHKINISYFKSIELLKEIKVIRILDQNGNERLRKFNKIGFESNKLFKALKLKKNL
ncbi:MAG: IS1634 family transposase [Candidatus Thorarchaeota archaeon]